MCEIREQCGDNRFEIIAAAKADILRRTNIETSPDEMKVLDNILFRCWQMGWLEQYNLTEEAVKNEVRLLAIDYFKAQSQPNKSRRIENAILGAEWRWKHQDEPFDEISSETHSLYPCDPKIGRTYADALNVCAFEYGASRADDIIKRRKRR